MGSSADSVYDMDLPRLAAWKAEMLIARAQEEAAAGLRRLKALTLTAGVVAFMVALALILSLAQ